MSKDIRCNKCSLGDDFNSHSYECDYQLQLTGKRIGDQKPFWNEEIKRWDFK